MCLMKTLPHQTTEISSFFSLALTWTSILTLFFFFISVNCQCSTGFEGACEWSHDNKSALKWIQSTDSEGYNIVELKDCKYPNCGTGFILSPWLEPRKQDTWTSIDYKIYGTSAVYLRMYLVTSESKSARHQIFSQTGNYAHEFPTSWSSKSVTLPATYSRYRLLLKAHTPYKEAYVAVKDIKLNGNSDITSSISSSAEREMEEENDLPGFADFETENDLIEMQEEASESGRFQALEEEFMGNKDLIVGYTRVIDPNICKYN